MNPTKMHWTNRISTLFYKFACYKFPSFIQQSINKTYVKFLGLDMNGFKNPQDYESLNELFTRALESPREIGQGIVSPCDSLVTDLGFCQEGRAFQIKDMSYDLNELFLYIDGSQKRKVFNGYFMNFYLSPKDYHRYHAPCDFELQKIVYVPAKLYPVNFKALKGIKHLFCKNERVILEGQVNVPNAKKKKLFLILVGALNVGKITLNFMDNFETNCKAQTIQAYVFDNKRFQKGQELGFFKMGSTVLAFFENETIISCVKKSQKVKMGETIAELV